MNNYMTTQEYFERFIEILKENPAKSHKDCYFMLENEFKTKFNRPKYKTYDSFRNAKNLYFDHFRD